MQGGSLSLREGKLLIKNRDNLDKKTQKLIKKYSGEIIEFLKPKEKVSQGPATGKTIEKKVNSDEITLEKAPERLKKIKGYDSLRQEVIKIINDNNNPYMRNVLMSQEKNWLAPGLDDNQIINNLQELKNRFELQAKKTEGFLGILKKFKELINS